MKSYYFVLIIFLILSCKSNKQNINISDFGAKGDSLTINTKFIQKAIDECFENGGGTVVVSDGVYITGTILLKDNVTLQVNENATLFGSANFADYINIDPFIDATGQARGNCLIGAKDATNIAITGKGTIDGNGENFIATNYKIQKEKNPNLPSFDRPFLIRIVNSSKLKMQDINIRQAAAWAVHLFQSHDITIDNVDIYNHANKNNDGIDIDSSYDITITNTKVNSEDDAICIKATSPLPTYNVKVSNCDIKSDWGAIKFGTESMGDFYNIDIRDCKIHDNKGGGIKLLSMDGTNIYNIVIDNIIMDNVDMPIFVRLGERLRTYRDVEKRPVGSINNVVISNIKATTMGLENSRVSPPAGILITGTPNHKIGSLQLKNIDIQLPGGGLFTDVVEVPEDETRYPEFSFFGVLPAYGMYARHIETLETTNVNFKVLGKDEREEIILEDVFNRN
ncbi:Polygalacturonase [Lutibacter agarilyticus]|uniref:Polygalacturonase n=1 Tax=Lutibacter agarilyticus TaxID=1109740 RepID=A0A238VB35_9FLAO|nr:glycosyl hydrolase family 28 protein [Lutibacter agarilyticus]SNR31411.1 Polygalacturonase [Lutibacter agarilyticus]